MTHYLNTYKSASRSLLLRFMRNDIEVKVGNVLSIKTEDIQASSTEHGASSPHPLTGRPHAGSTGGAGQQNPGLLMRPPPGETHYTNNTVVELEAGTISEMAGKRVVEMANSSMGPKSTSFKFHLLRLFKLQLPASHESLLRSFLYIQIIVRTVPPTESELRSETQRIVEQQMRTSTTSTKSDGGLESVMINDQDNTESTKAPYILYGYIGGEKDNKLL
ncbi:hypothetical protein EV361DRAFT_869480 [Lentinula raphanica]|nr:hypothetical protein EV361DRAFT_869480 [Lentinula raphanica]